jgi:hypothetical protein
MNYSYNFVFDNPFTVKTFGQSPRVVLCSTNLLTKKSTEAAQMHNCALVRVTGISSRYYQCGNKTRVPGICILWWKNRKDVPASIWIKARRECRDLHTKHTCEIMAIIRPSLYTTTTQLNVTSPKNLPRTRTIGLPKTSHRRLCRFE